MNNIEIGNIVFLNSYMLYFGVLFLLLFIFLNIKKRKSGIIFLPINDIKEIFVSSSYIKFFKEVLVYLSLFLFIILLSNPTQKIMNETISKEGIDIVLAIDISYSMKATDFDPNRIQAAKSVIKNFFYGIQSDRVGIVVFAGKPFTSVPLTFDYNFLIQSINELNVDTINQLNRNLQGTAIGDSMIFSSNLFKENREKVIIMLTDGENTAGNVDPIVASNYLRDKKIKLYSIGIGSLEGGYIEINTPFGIEKQKVGGIDENLLQTIANNTGGKYFRAFDLSTLDQIFDEIGKLEKSKIEVESITTYQPYYDIFVYPLVVVLFCLVIIYYFNYYID